MRSILQVIVVGVALLASGLAVVPAQADGALQAFVDQTLTAARDKDRFPGAAVLVQINGRIEAYSVVGVRALGHPDVITRDDLWCIGSDTKAFTSTLIGRLVDQGVMRFEDTLASSFPAFAQDLNPAYRDITVMQLLTHTAGLPPLGDDRDLPELYGVAPNAPSLGAQRAAIARHYLKKPQASKPGEFSYSNLGYIIAGAIAEAHTGKAWEDLVREQIFAPLGIAHAGFGSPGTPGKADQPWGHVEVGPGKLVPHDPATADVDSNTLPVIGPAGTIFIGLKDWLLFAQDHLDGVYGHGRLLKTETYRRLHTPATERQAAGWGSMLSPDGTPLLLTHSGSNGFWIADIRIMPKHGIITLVVINTGNEAANAAIVDIGKPLKDRLKPFD